MSECIYIYRHIYTQPRIFPFPLSTINLFADRNFVFSIKVSRLRTQAIMIFFQLDSNPVIGSSCFLISCLFFVLYIDFTNYVMFS